MRRLPSFLGTLGFLAFAAPLASAQDFTVEHVITGLDYPIYAGAPAGDTRIFVVEQRVGRIRIWNEGQLLAEPFLDLSTEVNTWFEGGLLSLAFHPDFASSGRAFVSLVDAAGDLVVREYLVSTHPDVADPTPVQELFRLAQPFPIHNGGDLEFGPDGMLYVAVGDGGPGGDPSGRAQDLTNPFGALLRLDVDLPAPHVPPDNPFVGTPGAATAIWAYGLRNPWAFHFDPATGDVWIGDVGQAEREEVDFLAAESGGGYNFGWRCREGAFCFDASCCDSQGLTEPLFEYHHIGGKCAVIGGGVYQGNRMPALQGTYICGDYCSRELYLLRQENGVLSSSELRPPPTFGGFPAVQKLHALGFDGQGEILMVDGGSGSGTGDVFRLVPKAGVVRYCSAGVNSTGTPALIDSQGPVSLTANDLALSVQGGVPGESGLFFYGATSKNAPFGDGHLCVSETGVGIFRIPRILTLDAGGTGSFDLDFADEPFVAGAGQLTPGSTWFFQFWYRDSASVGVGVNLTDALALTLAP